jgi:phosphatidylserine/phosphatidylglycerophosphate/cardiolipin synthase-like enzyme
MPSKRDPDATTTEASNPVRLEGLETIRSFVHERISGARRRLWILSPDLAPFIYDDPKLVDTISALARRSRHADVRILIQDSRSLPTGGHRLVDLALRMSSRIELRRQPPDEAALGEAMLLVDSGGFLHQPRADEAVAIAGAHLPPRVQTLEARFRTFWTHAIPDPELRRLKI